MTKKITKKHLFKVALFRRYCPVLPVLCCCALRSCRTALSTALNLKVTSVHQDMVACSISSDEAGNVTLVCEYSINFNRIGAKAVIQIFSQSISAPICTFASFTSAEIRILTEQ